MWGIILDIRNDFLHKGIKIIRKGRLSWIPQMSGKLKSKGNRKNEWTQTKLTKCTVPEISASRESVGQTGSQGAMARGCRSVASGWLATVCPAKSRALPAALQGGTVAKDSSIVIKWIAVLLNFKLITTMLNGNKNGEDEKGMVISVTAVFIGEYTGKDYL